MITIDATATDTKADADAWLVEVLYWLDMIDGGALDRLNTMLANMPAGPELFAVWRRISERMGVPLQSGDPLDETLQGFGYRAGNRVNAAQNVTSALVSGILSRLGALIEQGINDSDDPIIPRKHVDRHAIDQHGRMVVRVRDLPPGSPLATLEPADGGINGPTLTLGSPHAKYWRRSQVMRLTETVREQQAHERREQQRLGSVW